MRVAPALGSFDLTVRGVRKNAIRQVGSAKWLIAIHARLHASA
jgi:hypothetical protein